MSDTRLCALHLAASLAFFTACAHPFLTPKLLGLAVFIAVLAWRQGGFRANPAAVLLLVWPLVSGLWSRHAWDWLLSLGLPLLLGASLCLAPLLEKERQAMGRSLVWGAGLTSLYLLLQHLGLDPLQWEPGSVPGSSFGNPNFCADYLLLALCLGCYDPGLRGWLARALILLGIVISQSRGVWLACAVLLLVRAASPWRGRILLAYLLAALATGFALRGDLVQWASHLQGLQSYLSAYQDQPEVIDDRDPWFRGKRASLLNRLPLWANSLDLAAADPLLGCGSGQFRVTYPRHALAHWPDPNLSDTYRPESPHNLPLELVTQWGLPMTLALLWLAVRFGRRLERGPYRLALVLQVAIAMVSLNYLNPVIVVSLALLRPGEPAPGPPTARWLAAVVLAFGLAVAVLDVRALAPVPAWPDSRLFPEALAERRYADNAFAEAWYWQRRALDQDPYGPEVRNNLGIIAAMRHASGDGPRWLEIAFAAHRSSLEAFPYYRAAGRHLSRLEHEYPDAAPSTAEFFSLLPPP